MEVEMTIRGLLMDPVTNTPIVILKDVAGESVLPIWVGVYEANAIALEMEKVKTPRPMTHDLIKNVLTGLETQVHKVVVTELREDTFYAVIWLERGGEVISVDSRPSDALALALRVDCPIFVDEDGAEEFEAGGEHVGPGDQRRAAEVSGRAERRGFGQVQDVGEDQNPNHRGHRGSQRKSGPTASCSCLSALIGHVSVVEAGFVRIVSNPAFSLRSVSVEQRLKLCTAVSGRKRINSGPTRFPCLTQPPL